MDMYTSYYGHIKKPQKNRDFLTFLAWLSRLNKYNHYSLQVVDRGSETQLGVSKKNKG